MAIHFFKASRVFAERHTELFEFIDTASVALWNLRWQVQGFIGVRPDATVEEISGRFSSGTNIRAYRLRNSCIETTWPEQLGQFAQIVSANLIALFEGWAEELMPQFGGSDTAKQVQFPSRGSFGQRGNGISEALSTARATGISTDIEKAFYSVYSSNRKVSTAHLDAQLALYRYHKEVRNSFMHRGGIADARAEAAWRNASTLSRADVGMRSTPEVTPAINGSAIDVTFGQAIQLSDVLLRIVGTVDAELCRTEIAARAFMRDLEKLNRGSFRELPGDANKRSRKLGRACTALGYLKPADVEAVYALGRRSGVIAY
jgi:hypothetical protein